MKLYKLTNRYGMTRNYTQWGPGKTNSVQSTIWSGYSGSPQLCTTDVIHAYVHPLQMLLNRASHGFGGTSKQLWEAEGDVVVYDSGKVGVRSLTTTKRVPMIHGFDSHLERATGILLGLLPLLDKPLGHPRTGSKPIKTVNAAVKGFLSDLKPLGYNERIALRRGACHRIKDPAMRQQALKLVEALSWKQGLRGSPAQQEKVFAAAWVYIQPKLEAKHQASLALRRERDRARRALKASLKAGQ